MIIEKEVSFELDAEDIWDNLDQKDIDKLKEMFYDDFKDDYKTMLLEEGLIKASDL